MKKQISIFLMLFFISGYCNSQISAFSIESNKAYKITIKGAEDLKKADGFGRQMEKMELCIFSYVNPKSGTGYFIVDNAFKIPEIIKMINNTEGFSFVRQEEVPLTEDLFLELYMNRGGIEKSQFSSNKPKEIIMGPFQNLTYELYNKALSIWEKSYSKTFDNKIEKQSNELPEHYPIYVNTGNPDYDNSVYEKAKQEWIKNYPEEVEQITGRSYENTTGLKKQEEEKK